MLEQLLNMFCGDEITKGPYVILRVPGGWIYTCYLTDDINLMASTFVPEPRQRTFQDVGNEALLFNEYRPPPTKHCKHEWAIADNKHVTNAMVCIKCKTIRPKDPTLTKEVP